MKPEIQMTKVPRTGRVPGFELRHYFVIRHLAFVISLSSAFGNAAG
jgi:hypothetical protein